MRHFPALFIASIVLQFTLAICDAPTCPTGTHVHHENVGAFTSTHWIRRASAFLDGPLRKAALAMAFKSSESVRQDDASSHTLPPLSSTADILRGAGRHNDAHNCIFRVEYKSHQKQFFADHRNGTQCKAYSSLADALILRTEAFLAVLAFLIDSGKLRAVDFDPSTDFEFYVDTTDATPVDYDLFVALGRPLLSQSHSPLAGDKFTLPYPDIHQILGMAASAGYRVPFELEGFSASMAERYTGFDASGNKPWEEKKDAVVHRAQCVLTHGATLDASGQLRQLPVRGEICRSVQERKVNDVDFDVGTSLNELTTSSLTDLCKPCSDKEFLDWKQMASGWRYIVNSDGYGMSYDGSFWKLAANSTVFWVTSGSIDKAGAHEANSTREMFAHSLGNGPYWQAWYSVLLHPGCHYLPVKVDGIQQALDWCRSNEDRCREIADKGASVVRTLVTPDAMLQHLARTLTAVQRWQRETLDVWQEGKRRMSS